MALRDQPYLPLYVQDFLTDEKLVYCSASSTGVYIRLMCIMHKSVDYGKILLKQKFKQTVKQEKNFASQLALQLPYNLLEVENAITELVNEGVLQISGDILFQPRMVRDFDISEKRSSSGSLGGITTQNKIRKTKKNTNGIASNIAKANIKANSQANTEYEYEYENENENKERIDKGVQGEKKGEKKKKKYDVIDLTDALNVPFDFWWETYQKKVGDKVKLKKKWENLTDIERSRAIEHTEAYVLSTPDKTFRKNPETYLNNKSWNDEIIRREEQQQPSKRTIEQKLSNADRLVDQMFG